MNTIIAAIQSIPQRVYVKVDRTARTSISVQEKGRQICVYRNYPARQDFRDRKSPRKGLRTSKYIFAFPKYAAQVPSLDCDYHKVEDQMDRLTVEEHAQVVAWFRSFSKRRDCLIAQTFVGEERSYTRPPANAAVIDPLSLDLCMPARILHDLVNLIDFCELEGYRKLSVPELEQIIQALARVKRRIQMTGIRERDIHYKLFKSFDDQLLLAQEPMPDRDLHRGDSLYRKRSIEEIEKNRLLLPVSDEEG